MTNTALWHDLDVSRLGMNSSEQLDFDLMDEANWLELEYFGDACCFIELRVISKGEELNFYMSKLTAHKVYEYLKSMLKKGEPHE